MFMIPAVYQGEQGKKAAADREREALQPATNATTLRYRNGKVTTTDGPFIETKEQVGGIMILEARDLNRAIQLMSKHPSLRMGSSWEVRPAAGLSAMIEESKQRRMNVNR